MTEQSVKHFDQDFAADIANGLSTKPKYLQTRYIYDDEGSRLFEQIMRLDEYYLTNAEIDLLHNHKSDYRSLLTPEPVDVVELGAGNGEKTRIILEHFLEEDSQFTFRPLDISKGAIDTLQAEVGDALPSLDCRGMVADYFDGLQWLNTYNSNKRLVLFLGSNIGNFEPKQRADFLNALRASLNPGDMVAIGFDFKKDPALINKAYNDQSGVTAAFNRNILHRINDELGGEFEPEKFQFYAAYNPFQGCVQSTLMAMENHDVYIDALGQAFHFEAWEPIHTESSYKYTQSDIQALAAHHDFRHEYLWTDSNQWYGNAIWSVQS